MIYDLQIYYMYVKIRVLWISLHDKILIVFKFASRIGNYICITHSITQNAQKDLHILIISNNALINNKISKGNPFSSGSLIISILTMNYISKALQFIPYLLNGLTSLRLSVSRWLIGFRAYKKIIQNYI